MIVRPKSRPLARPGMPAFPSSGNAGYAFANVEAQTLVAAMTTAQSESRKQLIDALIGSLKSAGVWSLLDGLYVLAASDSQAALLNWKAPGTFTATATSSPTFTADRGYTGNGTTSYVDTNFNSTTAGGQFAQNNAHFGVWSLTSAQAVNPGSGNLNTTINPRNGSDVTQSRVNSGSTDGSIANVDGSGHYVLKRDNASDYQAYKNGASTGTISVVSAAPTNAGFGIGTRTGTSFDARQYAVCHFGAALTTQQVASAYAGILAYLQAIGAA